MVWLSVVAQPCLGTALGNDGENGHRAVTDVVKNPKPLDAESKLWFAQTPQPLDPALAGGIGLVPEVGLESPFDRCAPPRVQGEEVRVGVFGETDLPSHMAIVWPDFAKVKPAG